VYINTKVIPENEKVYTLNLRVVK